jgi:hypothetical protein
VKRLRLAVILLSVTGVAGAAHADDRDFCGDRPGKATPSCTLDPGRFQVEAGLFDYAHSRDDNSVEDDYTTGDMLLRYGVNDDMEARIGWDGYGWVRQRDRMRDAVTHDRGGGDITLSIKQNLRHPDDKGTAFAILPSLTLPVGGHAIGAGTWSAGVIVPFGADLAPKWRLTLDPEVDAAADQDRRGRHLAYALAAAVTRSVGQDWQLSAEGWAMRDDDPSGHETQASIDLSAAWQNGKNRQFDISTYIGATHATPRIEFLMGVSERF